MLDIGCVKTMSGAMRLGSATFTRLRENLVKSPISLRCVPLLISNASFMNKFVINKSFPFIFSVSPQSSDYITVLACSNLARTHITSILLRTYSTLLLSVIFLNRYHFDSRWTFHLCRWLGSGLPLHGKHLKAMKKGFPEFDVFI